MYPALAVWQRLVSDATQVLWVGSQGGVEEDLVPRAGLPLRTIPAAGVHGVGLRALPGNLWRLTRGLLAARRVLAEFRPQVLLFTGGYVAVPVGLAGWRVPTLLFVPDIEPGLALRTLNRFADVVAVSTPESQRFFPGKRVVVTGYPVRQEIAAWVGRRAEARQRLGLDPDAPVLLVTGGSKGARSLNRAVAANLEALLAMAQVVHLTGRLDWPAVHDAWQALPPQDRRRYRVFPFLYDADMGAALAAADLVVARAGASTLGEFPLFGLPAILVPYPYAWRYQQVNAAYLARRGAARVVADADLAQRLVPEVRALLHDAAARQAMRAASQALARPDAAERIAALLHDLAAGR